MSPSAFSRADALQRLESTEFDVVVVGGGITGVGCALDAASRGLRTALIERDDFASGTSSKSSKLVHGGIRYLQQGDIGLVYEALAERQRLRKNAPHMVSVLPFLIPIFSSNGIINRKLARAMGTAMWMYDFTGGLRIGKFHKRVSKEQALSYFPTLKPEKLMSSYLYYDAEADDARLCLTVAKTAAIDFGAVVVNRCALTEIEKNAKGNVVAVHARADGKELRIRTKSVVNATGVWSDDVRTMDESSHAASIRPAKGVHITVPWELVQNTIAAVIPVPGDKRSVFVVPWGEFTFVGTTDTDYDGPVDDPQCTADDIEYLLRALNGVLENKVRPADICGTWAGLRPLVADPAASGRTADLSRRHKVMTSPSGVVTITGGKLTTYRKMAADTIDELVKDVLHTSVLGRLRRRSRTKKLKLHGATQLDRVNAGGTSLTNVQQKHLITRYGSDANDIIALVAADPTMGEPLLTGLDYLKAEAIYAVRNEMATTLDDVLSRRTRARLQLAESSAAEAETVARLIAPELNWSEDEIHQQVRDYRSSIELERQPIELVQ